MNIPCSTDPVRCPSGTDGDDALISNAAIETPDVRMFFGYRFSLRSSNFCEATTQEAADLCALNPPDPFGSDIIFSSTAQTCTVNCPPGSPVTYTITSGAALGLSQAAADAAAYALACAYATIVCHGGTPTLVANEAQACSFTCPDGTVNTAIVPAGALLGLSLAEANTSAYMIACQAAGASCPATPPPPMFGNAATTSTSACPDGGDFTFHVAANTFFATTLGEANASAQSYADQQAVLQRLCMSAIRTSVCKDFSYDEFIFIGSEAFDSFTWSITSGSLPPNLTLGIGEIFGDVPLAGVYTFTVKAVQNSTGNFCTRTYQIGVINITTASPLTSGGTGTAYSTTLVASGIVSTASWSVTAGALPSGLSLSTSGVLSGTPTTAGSSAFTVTVMDVTSGWTCTKDFTITIALNPYEWWKLVNLVGSINSYALAGNAIIAGVPGKYGTGVGLNSQGGGGGFDGSLDIATPTTNLAYAGNGIDAFVWLKALAGGINGHVTFTLTFTDTAGTLIWSMSFDFHVTVGITYTLFPGGTSVNQVLAGSANYRMFELWYDPVTKFIGVRVDNGAVLDISSAPLGTAQPVAAKGTLQLLYSRITAGIGEVDACEMTVYPKVLTAPQRAVIYAAGAGATWPVTLP